VSGNSAWQGGSGVAAVGQYYAVDDYAGDAVVNLYGTTVVANATTGTNAASAQRGQVFAGISDTALVTMNHSVAWNGTSNDTDVGTQPESGSTGTSIAVTYSLAGSYNAGPGTVSQDSDSSSLEGMDPMLGGLTDNGGFTKTHLPAFGSKLINGGSSSGLDALSLNEKDQRGSTRASSGTPIGGNLDIGAVEIYDTNGDETLDNEPPQFANNFVDQVQGVLGESVNVNALDFITDPDGDTITPANVDFFGTLPAGLSYDNTTGNISGSFAAAGDFLVTVSATDNIAGSSVIQTTVTILAEVPPEDEEVPPEDDEAPPKPEKKPSGSNDDDDDGFLGIGSSTPAWLLALAGLLGWRRRR
jgi:MYXO-CTERM domain-containing protein